MINEIIGPRLEAALIKHGLVPPNCRFLEVVMEAMSTAKIRYEIFVTPDEMRRLAAAFTEAAGPEPAREPTKDEDWP